MPPTFRRRVVLQAVAVLLTGTFAAADDPGAPGPTLIPPWGPRLADLMQKYQACDMAGNETSPTACNIFVARALAVVYGVTDFTDTSRRAGYLNANTIADRLLISDKWEKLGTADGAPALKQASFDANNNLAVVAVWKNPDPKQHGHIALVLPGPMTTTSWGPVPNSASFFVNQPISNSYIGLPLSRAFKQELRPQVVLYHRKPD